MFTHKIVAYLISLAVGYWVLTLADKQKNLTKTVGQVIAWAIISLSILGPLCIGYCRIKCQPTSASCPWMGHSHCGDKGGMMDDKSTPK
jgi:hypothetical protein